MKGQFTKPRLRALHAIANAGSVGARLDDHTDSDHGFVDEQAADWLTVNGFAYIGDERGQERAFLTRAGHEALQGAVA